MLIVYGYFYQDIKRSYIQLSKLVSNTGYLNPLTMYRGMKFCSFQSWAQMTLNKMYLYSK